MSNAGANAGATNSTPPPLASREVRQKALTASFLAMEYDADMRRASAANAAPAARSSPQSRSSPSSTSSPSSSSSPPVVSRSGRSAAAARIKVPSFLTVAPQLDDLRLLRDTLENSLRHLTRTQRDIEASLLLGPDAELLAAHEENRPIVARYFKEIKEIQRLIITVTAHQGHGKDILFIPEEEWIEDTVDHDGAASAASASAGGAPTSAFEAYLEALHLSGADNAFSDAARTEREAAEAADLARATAEARRVAEENERLAELRRTAEMGLTAGRAQRAQTKAEAEAGMAAAFRAQFGAATGATTGAGGGGGGGDEAEGLSL
jgi:hypothetical protein